MKNNDIHDFTLRIAQASAGELVVITYDIILTDIKEAVSIYTDYLTDENGAGLGMIRSRLEQREQFDRYHKEINHAVRFVRELIAALDYHYVLAYELLQLYIYTDKCLVKAAAEADVGKLNEAAKIIGSLRTAYEVVAKSDKSGPVMKNTQQMTVGLTYGKNSLNEVMIDVNEASRGFRA